MMSTPTTFVASTGRELYFKPILNFNSNLFQIIIQT